MGRCEINELFTIELIQLKTDFPAEIEHILIVEIIGCRHDKFYFCELPVIDNRIRKRLRYYEHIIN